MATVEHAELEHVSGISSWDTGGGQVLDIFELSDGKVLVISEDAIVLYESTSDREAGVAKGRPTICRC